MPVARLFELGELLSNFLIGDDVVCAVNCRGDTFSFVPKRQVVAVQGTEL